MLESSGGNLSFKSKPIGYLENKKSIMQTLHFQKNHFSGFIQRRLGLFFVSNSLHKSIKKIDILAPFCSKHSPIFMSYKKSQDISLGKYFWKFISSLIRDDKYLSEMKEHIDFIKSSFDTNFENNPHSRWEF